MRGVEMPDGALPKGAEFDDENEATAVLDAERARALVSRAPNADIKAPAPRKPAPPEKRAPHASQPPPASKPPPPSPAAEGGGFSDDEATAVIDPERANELLAGEVAKDSEKPADSTPPRRGPGFEEEDDVTRVATAEAARELLRASANRDAPNDASDPPTVVVADAENAETTPAIAPGQSAKPTNRVKSSSKGRIHPVQLAIQNEPTRIVRVKTKPSSKSSKSRAPLWIGLIVIVVASAAGGLLASRFVSPRPAASSSK
jgi:hypothetical protein